MAKEKKFLMIDTCIWVYYFKYEEVREFINNIISTDEFELCTNEFIKYELEIGFKKESDFNNWMLVVNSLIDLPINQNDIKKDFVNYKKNLLDINRNKKENDTRISPSVADAVLASQLIHYGKGKFLMLTANNKDFPTKIFTKEKTEWADIPGSPISFCFYSYKIKTSN